MRWWGTGLVSRQIFPFRRPLQRRFRCSNGKPTRSRMLFLVSAQMRSTLASSRNPEVPASTPATGCFSWTFIRRHTLNSSRPCHRKSNKLRKRVLASLLCVVPASRCDGYQSLPEFSTTAHRAPTPESRTLRPVRECYRQALAHQRFSRVFRVSVRKFAPEPTEVRAAGRCRLQR